MPGLLLNCPSAVIAAAAATVVAAPVLLGGFSELAASGDLDGLVVFVLDSSLWTCTCSVARFFGVWWALGVLHEVVHLIVAAVLGCSGCWTFGNLFGCFVHRSVTVAVPGLRTADPSNGGNTISGDDVNLTLNWRLCVARHAGWAVSLALAIWTFTREASLVPLGCTGRFAAVLVASEAMSTDLFGWIPSPPPRAQGQHKFRFWCGNFGLILINPNNQQYVLDILRRMIQITMMRGAQSGGVVTYNKSWGGGLRGSRCRVVNGKRTDLSKLVVDKIGATIRGHSREPRIFAGHTRFATTSKATLDGTHPHQWSPPKVYLFYAGMRNSGNGPAELRPVKRSVETFICHNGDLEFFTVNDVVYGVEEVMNWIEMVTYHNRPSGVDSVAIAGIMEVLRTQGLWWHSTRFGYLFFQDHETLDHDMPSWREIQRVALMFQSEFDEALSEGGGNQTLTVLRANMMDRAQKRFANDVRFPEAWGEELMHGDKDCIGQFVRTTVDAFFDQDLLTAVRMFFRCAKGSFGVCMTNSLDVADQICLGARGQTISLAFYPRHGIILYGSEQAAVKSVLGIIPEKQRTGRRKIGVDTSQTDWGAVRLDLDDLGGEVALLDFGKTGEPSVSMVNAALSPQPCLPGLASIVLHQETFKAGSSFSKRLLPLQENPLVLPLPPLSEDRVGENIKLIPKTLRRITEQWEAGTGMNRLTAMTFVKDIRDRVRRIHTDALRASADTSVDLVVTGAEVSLWVGEQFAADLRLLLPRLNIQCISSNKLLALLGQELSFPATGFQQNRTINLNGSIILVISHSGGTFGSLATSNLVQPLTNKVFAVCSEWDTQIGKQLRWRSGSGEFRSSIFTTDIGMLPAEPCTLSVAATHHLLTLLLQYTMDSLQLSPEVFSTIGATFTTKDSRTLSRNLSHLIENLETITASGGEGGYHVHGPNANLRAIGRRFAQHVLEAPKVWILCAIYIIATVTSGYPLVGAVAGAVGYDSSHHSWLPYVTGFLDALVYLFFPQLMYLVVRSIEKRPLFHRMVGRSVVIGDVPWVAQCAEAFASKLFAVAYSNGGATFHSGNPADHLVHRFTHRVVRGGLLVVGRPDGRLSEFACSESAVCLSVNQASSIQNLGVTCESVTIGHNPYKLPLSYAHCTLPPQRVEFFCEEELRRRGLWGEKSPGALLGDYINICEESDSKLSGNELLQARFNKFVMAHRGLIASGADKWSAAKSKPKTIKTVHLDLVNESISLQLYEGRVASLERLVAFFVLFYEMGKTVQDFWPTVSCGLLKYDMSRTHSIMRIATTASPVSGSAVSVKMKELAGDRVWQRASTILSTVVKQRNMDAKYKRRTRQSTASFTEAGEDASIQEGSGGSAE